MDKFTTEQLMHFLNGCAMEMSDVYRDISGVPHGYFIDKIISIIEGRGHNVLWASFKFVCFYN